MKRESGENPEQSRCCVLIRSAVQSHLPLPYNEGGKANSKSESEDLQNDERRLFGTVLSRKEGLPIVVIHRHRCE